LSNAQKNSLYKPEKQNKIFKKNFFDFLKTISHNIVARFT